MLPPRNKYILVVTFALFFFSAGVSFALEDGFGPARKTQGKHFVIYYAPQLDPASLAQTLNISASDRILVGKSAERNFSADEELADTLDTLFSQVCDILDMQLYSFQGNIKICRDYAQLNRIYRDFFHKELGTRSFYVHNSNTVYTSADNFRLGIVGHEIAHAIICHYFVVLPSVKVQEVLAMYVEYQLKRMDQ
jgi:hypothetical protein